MKIVYENDFLEDFANANASGGGIPDENQQEGNNSGGGVIR